MNSADWTYIRSYAPNAFEGFQLHERITHNEHQQLFDFFDRHELFVVVVRYTGMPKPWGFELYGRRFIRHEAAYLSREDAEKAGFQTAFEELQKLILAANA